jgi:2,3,4,5-tetrahydropyridine-2-carboxylate N-succinyltransferase
MNSLQTIIEQALGKQALLQEETTKKAIREVIELLDSGKLRVADDAWQINRWVKESSYYVFQSKNGNMGSRDFLNTMIKWN